ncbi:hypothetical protein JW756_06050 [Candidatus Woesearchaeota archaeon]|nr:hypothetical protein [Candidatus Woesearchaeota archaeon]
MTCVFASESARIFFRRVRVLFCGLRKYPGDDVEVCNQIIRECYNNKDKQNYFMVSKGHFCEFYARDFGWCAEALISLGYRDEVIATLDYALGVFEKHGRLEQSISPSGKPFTFPGNKYSPDSLAFIVRSLKLARAKGLVKKYKSFLNHEVKRYYDIVIDKKTGFVRKDQGFSSMKDYSIRKSSCYDNVMAAMLAGDLAGLGLDNPFKKHDYGKLLVRNFWTGEYFLDDLSGNRFVCGDANVLPFWSGVITGKALLRKAVNSMRKEGLDKPFPLKYTKKRFKGQKMIGLESIAGNYERDAVWPHIGLMYIRVVAGVDKKLAKYYLGQYSKMIELHRNFLEVYDKNGKPFKTLFYYADESMLWAANYVYLRKMLG